MALATLKIETSEHYNLRGTGLGLPGKKKSYHEGDEIMAVEDLE
jgi:hypothetical protein